jgi:hypothetical protein
MSHFCGHLRTLCSTCLQRPIPLKTLEDLYIGEGSIPPQEVHPMKSENNLPVITLHVPSHYLESVNSQSLSANYVVLDNKILKCRFTNL